MRLMFVVVLEGMGLSLALPCDVAVVVGGCDCGVGGDVVDGVDGADVGGVRVDVAAGDVVIVAVECCWWCRYSRRDRCWLWCC